MSDCFVVVRYLERKQSGATREKPKQERIIGALGETKSFLILK